MHNLLADGDINKWNIIYAYIFPLLEAITIVMIVPNCPKSAAEIANMLAEAFVKVQTLPLSEVKSSFRGWAVSLRNRL